MTLLRALFQPYIKRRLGGYIEVTNAVDRAKPTALQGRRTVAVIGGGLAGLSAASLLAERGFEVTLFERNAYLGGKTGCWEAAFKDGSTASIDHGFHAFFRHYYNLQAFLEKVGARDHLQSIDDYLIVAEDGRRFSFKNVETTPVLNIVSLGRQKFFRFRDVLLNPPTWRMGDFVKYDEAKTFAEFDTVSFEELATQAQLPDPLKLVFHTFGRAFFAPTQKLSAAELMKSFHFFYLSHDHGLLYDYFDTDYGESLIEPVRRHLLGHNVSIRLDKPVVKTDRKDDKFIVRAETFDGLVLACDVVGARELCRESPWIKSLSEKTHRALTSLEASDGYAVYRVWMERQTSPSLPVFIITEKRDVLDSVTFYHRFDKAAAAWAQQTGGGVYELHCYALPPEWGAGEALKAAFLAELCFYFPELRGARILRDHLQVKHDFTAFHTGLYQKRPEVKTGIPGFYLAGDWVKIPTPAMLMEAAVTSGLLSANCILTENGLQEAPVYSVPRRGIFS